ncbi:hypothetical protein Poly21_07660 [Allorhodopirellula heiligendammensis]|uniref:Uncharacterized protein n=1 Tax=Allorhodopirellula heiligendammensis TaxID=2714739 RepID=A0A5C6C389_9BACT|nr:hypothetical protein Poly21_07660 [Allorhodopirellula heiligendammensis]
MVTSDELPGDVVQFAVSKLDAEILVAVSAGFSLSAVSDSISDSVRASAMGTENSDDQMSGLRLK